VIFDGADGLQSFDEALLHFVAGRRVVFNKRGDDAGGAVATGVEARAYFALFGGNPVDFLRFRGLL
jgi:hypothetical protein